MIKLCFTIKIRTAGAAGIDIRQTGTRIKTICTEQGITVKQIQKELDIGFQSVYAWFAGNALPSLENIYQLGGMLEIPVDRMIVGVHKKTCFRMHPVKMEERRMEKLIWKYYTYGLAADDEEFMRLFHRFIEL